MKKVFICLFVICLMFPTAARGIFWSGAEHAVKVNGEVILMKDFESAVEAIKKEIMVSAPYVKSMGTEEVEEDILEMGLSTQELEAVLEEFGGQGEERRPEISAEELEEIRRTVLHQLIEEKIINQEARRRGIKAGKGAVEKRFEELRKGFSSSREFLESLEAQPGSIEEVKKGLRKQLLVEKIIAKLMGAEEVVSTAEVESFFERNVDLFVQTEYVSREAKLAEARERIERFLLEEKKRRLFDRWLKGAKGKARIEVNEKLKGIYFKPF